MLAADLDEWRISSGNYVPQHSRARRDEEAMAHPDKCRRRRYKPCCTTESMDSIHMNEKEHKKECLKEIYGKEKDVEDHYDPFKCDKVNKHRKDMTVSKFYSLIKNLALSFNYFFSNGMCKVYLVLLKSRVKIGLRVR